MATPSIGRLPTEPPARALELQLPVQVLVPGREQGPEQALVLGQARGPVLPLREQPQQQALLTLPPIQL